MINKKGFTLLELVIVIGILAVLGAVSVLVLNPAQLFAQARDTTRIEDMSVLRNALALMVSTINAPEMDGSGALACATMCFVQESAPGSVAIAENCGGRHAVARLITEDNDRTVDGTGWIPANMTLVPGGPALSVLPIDPTNSATYFYSYVCDNSEKTYELNAKMESSRYRCGGSDDKERTDGGNKPVTAATACNATQPSQDEVYELGTDAGLNL